MTVVILAPGSQNGFDNSGLRNQIEWQTGSNVAITKDVIRALASKYAQSNYNNVVVAIQLLNERVFSTYADLTHVEILIAF